MFNLFKKKEKNFDKFFDGMDAIYLRLVGISQVTHPEQAAWFFNPMLKESVKILFYSRPNCSILCTAY
jgi:hypothetical protein